MTLNYGQLCAVFCLIDPLKVLISFFGENSISTIKVENGQQNKKIRYSNYTLFMEINGK